MKYKLKEHVTDEMLVEVGFEIQQFIREKTAWRYNINDDNENHLYIVLDEKAMSLKTLLTRYTLLTSHHTFKT